MIHPSEKYNNWAAICISLEKHVKPALPGGVSIMELPDGRNIFPIYGSDGGILPLFGIAFKHKTISKTVIFSPEEAADSVVSKILDAAKEIA